MRTSKPVSTISYNTEEFLVNKINYWKQIGWVEFAMWIRHEPDVDDKKAHYHVYIKPAQLIQTMDLEQGSMEFDPNNPGLPLKMIGFRFSKEEDWVLYGIHDKNYLASKGLTRNFHYDLVDIQCTDYGTLGDIITHISMAQKGRIETRIIDSVAIGMTWHDLVLSGIIPLRYLHSAKLMYETLTGVIVKNE